jgi:hypothetical protein
VDLRSCCDPSNNRKPFKVAASGSATLVQDADRPFSTNSGHSASAQTRTFRLAIRAPNNNGHSFSAIFPVSPSPIGYFGKEKLGTDFGKAKLAGVRQRDRGGETPRSTFAFGKAGSTAIAKTGRSIDRRSSESLAQKLQTNQDTPNHNEKAGGCSFLFSR